MEGLIILIMLGCVVVILGLPVAAWVASRQTARRLESLQIELDSLRARVERLTSGTPQPPKAV